MAMEEAVLELLHTLVARIFRPYQGSVVLFIIDDGNFLLPDEAVLEVLLFTMEHGPPLGIHLNAGKTELLMANTVPMMPLIHSSRSSRNLKVPIGSSRRGFVSFLMITLAMLPFTAHVY